MAQLKISIFLVRWYPQQDFYSETFSWFISFFKKSSAQLVAKKDVPTLYIVPWGTPLWSNIRQLSFNTC
jgi:hypothetical protein